MAERESPFSVILLAMIVSVWLVREEERLVGEIWGQSWNGSVCNQGTFGDLPGENSISGARIRGDRGKFKQQGDRKCEGRGEGSSTLILN